METTTASAQSAKFADANIAFCDILIYLPFSYFSRFAAPKGALSEG